MNSIFRKTTLVLLVIFALSITGCLSNNVNQPTAKAKGEVVDPETPDKPYVNPNERPQTDPTDPAEQPRTAYNPFGNKAPMITLFKTDDLDSTTVAPGQEIVFEASAIDPEGDEVSIRYEATGGKMQGSKWTAPSNGGIFQIKAIANDGLLDSEFEMIEVKVPGKEGGVQVAGITTAKTKNEGPARTISSQSITNPSKLILETSESVDITLNYTTTDTVAVTYGYSVSSNTGSMAIKTKDTTGSAYSDVYTYTAPATAPTGGVVTITFSIVNVADATDYADATVTFYVNTAPSITTVEFNDINVDSISPSSTKTIIVTATDVDASATLTYNYLIVAGSGSLSETTNTTGQVDYTSGASAGDERLVVTVTDEKGGSDQYSFAVTNMSPMYAAIADSTASTLTYAQVVTDGVVNAAYDLTTTDSVSGFTSSEISYPIQASNAADATYDGSGAAGISGFKAYYSNNPSTTITYAWSDKITSGSSTVTLESAAASATKSYTNNAIQEPEFLSKYPGAHTVTARVTSNGVNVDSSDTVYVNEPPSFSSISFTDSGGNTVSLWNGTTTATPPQVSAGQKFELSIAVEDPDNTRVSPTTNGNGFFADTSSKFAMIVPASATAWEDTLVGLRGDNIADESSYVKVNSTSTGDDYELIEYTNTDTVKTSFSGIAYEVLPEAPTGALHVVFRASDGWDNVVDGSIPFDVNNNGTADAGDDIGASPLTFDVLPDANGIPVAAADGNTCVEDAILVGYNPYWSNRAGDFYLEYVTDSDGSGTDAWILYDVTNGTYAKDTSGNNITYGGNGALAEADDKPSTTVTTDTSWDWLLIDENVVGTVAAGTLAYGDKYYFKTHATNIVVEFEVVDGPQITAVSNNEYVTVNGSSNIEVIAKGMLNSGVQQAATVTMSELTSSGGTLAQGTDSDGDVVSGEVWTYTAPASFTSSTVTIRITVTDNSDSTKTVYRDVTFYLNQSPVIGAVNATSNVDTTDGNWVLYGTHNISLSAAVTDPDSNDTFSYVWDLPTANTGKIDFSNTSSAIWDPYNGATALTATGGSNNNGQYSIQLFAYDKDSNGVAKTGVDAKTIVVGINENPDVGTAAQEALLVDAPTHTSYSTTYGPDWDTPATYVDDLDVGGTGDEDDDPGSGADTITIDFNTEDQYPGVKVQAVPQYVTDEPDDKSGLNFMYFMTAVEEDGTPVTTENFEYYEVAANPTSYTATQGLRWTPSEDMRKTGGTYYLHFRVTDDKSGVAKGITDFTEKLVVLKDSTLSNASITPDATDDVQIKDFYDGAAGQNGNGWVNYAGVAGVGIKAGTRIKFNLAVPEDLPRDTQRVFVDLDELISGTDDLDEGTIDESTDAHVWHELTRNTGTDVNDPSDDYFEYEWIAPVSGAANSDSDLLGATDIAINEFKVIDTAGNSNDKVFPNGITGVALVADAEDWNVDYQPLELTAITYDATTLLGGAPGKINDDGTLGGDLNGDTDLIITTEAEPITVLKIGDRPGFTVTVGDFGATAGDSDSGDVDRVAAIADLTPFNVVNRDGDTAIVDEGAETIGVEYFSGVDKINLETDTINQANLDPLLAGHNQDIIVGENNTISTWRYGSSTIPTYEIDITATDDALVATADLTWPATSDLGNTVTESLNMITGGLTGIDLKRPDVLSVEVYSYDEDATEGQTGYAPIGRRRTTPTAAAIFSGTAVVDAGNTHISATAASSVGDAVTLTIDTTIAETNEIAAGDVINLITNEYYYLITTTPGDATVGTNNYDMQAIALQANSAAVTTDDFEVLRRAIPTLANVNQTISYTTSAAATYAGHEITITASSLTAGVNPGAGFVQVEVGDILYIDDAVNLDAYIVTEAQKLETGNSSIYEDTTILVEALHADNGAHANEELYFGDVADFRYIDYRLISETDGVAEANAVLDDDDATTAEIMKITFSEPMGVNFNQEANLAATQDGNLGSTLNDVSIEVKKYRTDGTTLDTVSEGSAAGDLATVTGATDVVQLDHLRNFAYRVEGFSTTDTSVLYIVMLDTEDGATVDDGDSDGLGDNTGTNDTLGHFGSGSHFEVIFNNYADVTNGGAEYGVLTDFHGNAINADLNNFRKGQSEISW